MAPIFAIDTKWENVTAQLIYITPCCPPPKRTHLDAPVSLVQARQVWEGEGDGAAEAARGAADAEAALHANAAHTQVQGRVGNDELQGRGSGASAHA